MLNNDNKTPVFTPATPGETITEMLRTSIENKKALDNDHAMLFATRHQENLIRLGMAVSRNVLIDPHALDFEAPNVHIPKESSHWQALMGTGPVTNKLIEYGETKALFECYSKKKDAPGAVSDDATLNDLKETISVIREKSNYVDLENLLHFNMWPHYHSMKADVFKRDTVTFSALLGFIYEATLTDSKSRLLVRRLSHTPNSKAPWQFDNTQVHYYHDVEGIFCATGRVINKETEEVFKAFDNELLRIYQEEIYSPAISNLMMKEAEEFFDASSILNLTPQKVHNRAMRLIRNLVQENPNLHGEETVTATSINIGKSTFVVATHEEKFLSILFKGDFVFQEVGKHSNDTSLTDFFSRSSQSYFEDELRRVLNWVKTKDLNDVSDNEKESFKHKLEKMIHLYCEIKFILELAAQIKSYGSVTTG